MTLSSSYIMCVYRTLFVTVCVCHTGLIKATCLLVNNNNAHEKWPKFSVTELVKGKGVYT